MIYDDLVCISLLVEPVRVLGTGLSPRLRCGTVARFVPRNKTLVVPHLFAPYLHDSILAPVDMAVRRMLGINMP